MVGGESNKCVPLKFTVSGQEYETGTCARFYPEGQAPAEGAIKCEQKETDGRKGTVCTYPDPSQEGAELPAGVPTERVAARFAPRPAPGAELTDEQKVQLEEVRREIAPDETGKSSDEALADRLSKSSTVGTIASAMFMFNPLVKILYTAGAFSFLSEVENRDLREENAALKAGGEAAGPADKAAEGEAAPEAGKVQDSRVIPEGSIAALIDWKSGKPRVDEESLIIQLVLGSPLAFSAISTNESYLGEVLVFAEREAAKYPNQETVILKVADIEARVRERMQADLRPKLSNLEEKAEAASKKAASAPRAPKGGRGGKRTGKGKKAKKAKKKSGGGIFDDY